MYHLIFTIFICLVEAIIGICEAVYLEKYSIYNDGCFSIWEWILASCILSIICALCIVAHIVASNFKNQYEPDPKYIATVILLFFIFCGQFIVSMGLTITSFQIGDVCRDHWISNAPELWTLTVFHIVMFWIMLVIIGALTSYIIICTVMLESFRRR